MVLVRPVKGDVDTFEEYRAAILERYGIDIAEFKDKLMGGRANGKPITDYKLDQILMGIQVETEHTDDPMTALEIAMDHLEEIPEYYTRLKRMEEQAQLTSDEHKVIEVEPDAKLVEILISFKTTNPDGIVETIEEAISPETRRKLAELIRSRLEKTAFDLAIDFEKNVARILDKCEKEEGVPMFRTRYAGERFKDPENPERYMVLFICYGRHWSQWFWNVSEEDIIRLER
jgi:hypothetical protein